MAYIHLTSEDHRRLFDAISTIGTTVETKRELFFAVCDDPTPAKWTKVREHVLAKHGQTYLDELWARLADRSPVTVPKRH